MAWTEFNPTDIDHLCTELNKRIGSWRTIYRGQSDSSWSLEPSLLRDLKEFHPGISEQAQVDREVRAVDFFKKKSPLRLLPTELSFLESVAGTLLLMQHYGAPTRVLDWSLSPWVGAYFAAVDHPKKDGAIWLANGDAIDATCPTDKMHVPSIFDIDNKQPICLFDARRTEVWEKITLNVSGNMICVLNPRFENPRMAAQQSVFTMAARVGTDHVDLGKVLQPSDTEKIIIPAAMKAPLLLRLFKMNLVATNLFPDITGIARHAREAVRYSP